MTNITKRRIEAKMEKVGIDVETVDMSKFLRNQEIQNYKKISSLMMYKDDYKCNFENSFVKNKKEKIYKKSFEDFCNNFSNFMNEGFGIYMTGEAGTGKSHYTNCIYNQMKDEYIVFKTSIITLFDEIFKNFGGMTKTDFLRNRLGKAELIIIEDLGNENIKDWGKENLYFIFDFIFKAKKPIIINTNLSDVQMEEYLWILGCDKLLSRLKSKCKYYKFDWEDRRIGMYKEEIDKWY